MEILITNDDGYKAKGIHVLAKLMSRFGNVTVIAPKVVQSGMSMAVNLGDDSIEYKKLSSEEAESEYGDWAYIDATPASCVKFALNTKFVDKHPDILVSGINHGSNASTAACYSGTLGACEEGTLNGVPSIGVSLDRWSDDADFSAVEKYFPAIFEKLCANLPADRKGLYYNINFPDLEPELIKGVKVGRMGMGRWIREFRKCSGGEQHSIWKMVGDYVDDPDTPLEADNLLMQRGYISIVAHQLDSTDYRETQRLEEIFRS